jgi:hypothetical protein
MLNDRKNFRRAVSLITAFSVILMVLMPYAESFGIVRAYDINLPSGDFFTDSLKMGEELGSNNQAIQSADNSWTVLSADKIDGISVTVDGTTYTGNPIRLDGGSDSSKYINLTMDYTYTRAELEGTSILTNNYLCYQLPSNLRMAHEYFGENCTLTDEAWSTVKPSGYYSISSTGLLVMRYTDEYINFLKSQSGGFTGSISFNGYIDRSNTASGDSTVSFNTKSGTWNVEVAFNDDQITMSKYGEVKDSEDGKYIEWTINITNPGGRTNLSSYVLSDKLNNNDYSLGGATINPAGAATVNKDVINFNNSGDANITIKYNQTSPVPGTNYTNKATLKDGSNQAVAEAEHTKIIENGYIISKSGKPDYDISGTKEGKIRWEIVVESKSGESLAGTSVTDTFNFPSDTAVYNYSTNASVTDFSMTDNTLTFGSGVPSKMKIVYYTSTDISTLNTDGRVQVSNNATINPPSGSSIQPSSTGDQTVTYEKGVAAEKFVDTIDIEDHTIKWRVKVYSNKTQNGQDNNSKASVNGYTVKDSMLTDIGLSDVSYNAQDTKYQNRTANVHLSKSGDTITISTDSTANGTDIVVNFVELFYTTTLTSEQISTLNRNGSLSVTNNATVNASGGITGTGTATANIQLRHSLDKRYQSDDRSGSEIGTVTNEPDSKTLPWMVELTSDNGFADRTYTDTLQSDNSAVAHYFTSEQQGAFVLEYKTTDSAAWTTVPSDKYNITFTDTNGDNKDDKFVINFDSSIDNSYHYLTISYNSTADTKNTPNGEDVHLNNTGQFDNDAPTSCNGYYFTREDPTKVKNMSLSLKKNWNDSQNIFNGRPSSVSIKVYYALCDENGNIPSTDSDSWSLYGTFTRNVSSSNGYDDIQLGNGFPQWAVENGQVKRYYYKIVEDPVPASYDESYTTQTVLADADYKNFEMTNTSTKDYGKRAVEVDVKEQVPTINSINYEDVPKLTINIDGNDTECYIFGWDILINKSAANPMTYIDTLPDNARFIDNTLLPNPNPYSQDPYGQYKIHTKYADGWYADASDFYGNNRGTVTQEGRTLTFALNRVDDSHVISFIRYYTAIPVDELSQALEDGKLVNKVKKSGRQDVAAELSVVEPEKPIIEKKFLKGLSSGYINYELTVNPEGRMLSNDGMVDITDDLTFNPGSGKFGDVLDIELDKIEVYPIVDGVTSSTALNEGDYSYTVVYDEEETRTLNVNSSVVQTEYSGYKARYWVIEGYEIGETIEVTINRTNSANISQPQLWAFKVLNHDSPQLYSDIIDQSATFPNFTNGKSTLSYTVKPNTNVLIVFDKAYNYKDNPGGDDFAVESIESVTAKNVTPAKLELSVPDQQPLKISYTYRVTGWTDQDKILFDNMASIDESNASGSATQTESEMLVTSSSGHTSTLTYTKLYKVDVGNYALNTLDATFKIAKYVDGTGWVYASNIITTRETGSTIDFKQLTFPDTPYTNYLESNNKYPSAAANLVISQSENVHNIQLESGTLYKLVETAAPNGYHTPPADGTLTPEFEYYYNYHNYSGTVPAEAEGKVKNILNNGSINIPNIKDINLSAEKIFSGDDIPSNSTVVLELYRSKSKSGTNAEKVTGSEKTLNFVSGGTNNKVEWTGLPSGNNGSPWYYFVREVSYTGTSGTKYTCAADGSNSGRFKPVYTGNGTNTNDTCIEVNNSQGLTVKKLWQNKDGVSITPPNEPNTSTPMSVAFDIYGEANGERIKLNISETLNSSNGYSYKLPDPVNDTNGTSHSISEFSNFYVEEKLTSSQSESLEGTYLEPQINKKISNGTGVIEILNIADISGYMNVSAEKVWNMNGSSANHLDNVTVKLIQSSVSGLTESELQNGSSTINWGDGNSGTAEQTLNSGNNWSCIWSGLPKADSNNAPYYYYVIETSSLDRYTVSYNTTKTSNSSQKTVITNTFKTIDLNVQKVWDDNGETKDHSGETIKFVIKRSTDPNHSNPSQYGSTESITVEGKTFSVTAAPATVYQGEAINLTAMLDEDNVTSNTTFKVNGTEISNPYSNTTPGTYTITAEYTQGGKTYTKSIDVTVQSRGVQITNGESANVTVGGDLQLSLSFTDSGTHSNVTYSSSNTSIATVDANGKITGVSEGTAVITVTDAYGNSDTITVNVTAAAPSDDFTLSGPDSMIVGQQIVITPSDTRGGITYTITDNRNPAASVSATTDAEGKWTAVLQNMGHYENNASDNKFTLTATRGNCTQTQVISVGTANRDVSQSLNNGDKVNVVLKGEPNASLTYELALQNSGWGTEYDTQQQTITLDGNGYGTVTIDVDKTISSPFHIGLWYASIPLEINDVTVTAASTPDPTPSFSISPKTSTITVNGNVNFTPTITNGSGEVTYTVSLSGSDVTDDEDKVSISGNTITFMETGIYTVTASVTIDNVPYTDTATITVNESSGGFTASISPTAITAGDTETLITITASDTITAINADGKINFNSPSGNTVSGHLLDWVQPMTITINIVHSYYPDIKTQVSLVVNPASTPNSQSNSMKGVTLTPYLSEIPSSTEQQPRSKRSVRPLRGGDITKTVGAEAENSEVKELFFNTNVSDIIEMSSGNTPNSSVDVVILGGKVKLKTNKGANDNDWTKQIFNLPATDENGNTYYYWIEELPVEGYTASYGNNNINAAEAAGQTATITITNTAGADSVEFPETGGQGIKKYYMAGGVMMLLAAAAYVTFKRRGSGLNG